MKLIVIGASALAVVLTGCNTVSAGNSQQFFDNIEKFNQVAGQHCSGNGRLDWNPPLAPAGSLHVECSIGQGTTTTTTTTTTASAQPAVKSPAT
jgi:hypothetical protein